MQKQPGENTGKMPRKRRCSVMQKKKYHYKKVKSEESPTNEDGVCLETKDSSCLDSSQLDHSYGVSDPEEVSVVNSTHLDHSYECSDPEEFCRTSTSHHDISNGCQDLKELPHSDFLPPGELGDGDSELNIDSDSNGPESVVHNDIPLRQRLEVETVEITDPCEYCWDAAVDFTRLFYCGVLGCITPHFVHMG
uniref:Uncharacterized protein n=1 Tax=Magallana gigas TaxID=29159 RepID=K1Q5E1_MAGGI